MESVRNMSRDQNGVSNKIYKKLNLNDLFKTNKILSTSIENIDTAASKSPVSDV